HIGTIGMMAITFFLAVFPVGAQDSNSASVTITSPKDGDSLFGLVTIQGSANQPQMQRYVLEFSSQETGTDSFFPIAGPISQQVNGGVLGQWNTTAIPDGRYQIRLRLILKDGTVLQQSVKNLHVSNKQP